MFNEIVFPLAFNINVSFHLSRLNKNDKVYLSNLFKTNFCLINY